MDELDGNLSSLRAYERRQDAIDAAWEIIKLDLEPLLAELDDVVLRCYAMNDIAEEMGFDFTDNIREELENIINQ